MDSTDLNFFSAVAAGKAMGGCCQRKDAFVSSAMRSFIETTQTALRLPMQTTFLAPSDASIDSPARRRAAV
jgi:hypothetical protein